MHSFFPVEGKIIPDACIVRYKPLRWLFPVRKQGVVVPVFQNFCILPREYRQQPVKLLSDRLLPDADGGILFKRRIFPKNSNVGLDGLWRLNVVKIGKLGKLCIGIILPKPRQNAVHDEQLLIGWRQSPALCAVTVAALGVIQPKIVVIRCF